MNEGIPEPLLDHFIMISVVVVVYMVITDNLDVLPWALAGGAVGSAIMAVVLRK